MWTLDPIDGTKGFLRGGQYAVCLALLVDARVELGVIGCPNLPSAPLPSSQNTDDDAGNDAQTQERGALFVAVRGHGAYQLPLHPAVAPPPPHGGGVRQKRLSMPRLALHELSFLESVEKAHAALDTNALVATRLGVRAAAPVRMDSQAKYAALVRGDAGGGVYLRLPVAGPGSEGGYQEKIWVRALHVARRRAKCKVLSAFFFANHRIARAYVCRITPLDHSSSKRPVVSSRIIVGVRSTLASGARLVRILVSWLRGRRSMRR